MVVVVEVVVVVVDAGLIRGGSISLWGSNHMMMEQVESVKEMVEGMKEMVESVKEMVENVKEMVESVKEMVRLESMLHPAVGSLLHWR